MTRFEKIKEQIASASMEDIVLIMLDPPCFRCALCESYLTAGGHCDHKCLEHCKDWINSPVPDE